MHSFVRASGALALSLAATTFAQDSCPPAGTCQSFGVDFTSGGVFFQNTLSNELFNATQEFVGCQDDASNNILIGPAGDSFECDTTSLVPDDEAQTFSCPVEKSALDSGDYSIVIISNNGDCSPIAYQRDFSINAAPQQTSTVTPTLTIETAFTPIVTAAVTSTTTVTSTARTSTTTVPRFNFNPTITIRPLPSFSWVTSAILTYTSTTNVPNVVGTSTATATASCEGGRGQRQNPDPQPAMVPPPLEEAFQDLAEIVRRVLNPFNLKERDATVPELAGLSVSAKFKRAIIEGRAIDPDLMQAWLRDRHERLAKQNGGLAKRAPDQPTITVTDESAAPITVTSTTSTASTETIFTTQFSTQTSVTTPLRTISRGFNFGIDYTTASARTITKTVPVLGTQVVVTRTTDATLTITSTTTPAEVAAACTSNGGTIA